MRQLLSVLFLVLFLFCNAQEKFLDREGIVFFEASRGTFVPIKAENEKAILILNATSGELAALTLIKEFTFRNALMQEHFNENYLESDSFPKATFKGKIVDFDSETLTSLESQFVLEGFLKIHGVTKSIRTAIFITKSDSYIHLRGAISVEPESFDIKIPKIISYKIANQVKIDFNFKLKKQ